MASSVPPLGVSAAALGDDTFKNTSDYALRWMLSPREAAELRGSAHTRESCCGWFCRKKISPFLDKWKIIFRVLPLAALFVSARVILYFLLPDFKGYFSVSQVAFIFSGSIFVMGIVFTGVMSDFKEAERAPSGIAATLEGLEDSVSVVHASRNLDAQTDVVRARIRDVIDAMLVWISEDTSEAFIICSDNISALCRSLEPLDRANGATLVSRLLGEVNSVRHVLTRLRTIRDTSFLPAVRALLQLGLWFNVGVATVATYDNLVITYVSIGFIAVLFSFLSVLADDVDNPLERPSETFSCCDGAASIDLHPLVAYREKLAVRIESRRMVAMAAMAAQAAIGTSRSHLNGAGLPRGRSSRNISSNSAMVAPAPGGGGMLPAGGGMLPAIPSAASSGGSHEQLTSPTATSTAWGPSDKIAEASPAAAGPGRIASRYEPTSPSSNPTSPNSGGVTIAAAEASTSPDARRVSLRQPDAAATNDAPLDSVSVLAGAARTGAPALAVGSDSPRKPSEREGAGAEEQELPGAVPKPAHEGEPLSSPGRTAPGRPGAQLGAPRGVAGTAAATGAAGLAPRRIGPGSGRPGLASPLR